MAQDVISSSGTFSQLFAVSSTADTTINVPDNDIVIEHTGIAADGSTVSGTADYVVIMNAFATDGTTANTMVATYAAGPKLCIPVGQGRGIRGYDATLGISANKRALIARASGSSCMIQIYKGSVLGRQP